MADAEKNKKILSVRDLVVEYCTSEETVHAVNDVSFELDYGQTIGLVGETGAGKTTIAKTIMGILPAETGRVRQGEILIEDKNVLSMDNKELYQMRGEKMSMVFQDPMTALNPVMQVGKQIMDGIRQHEKCSQKEAKEKAQEIFEKVGITKERFNEYPHQFSGGMKQRVVIAMALACDPDLLIADEPTTALDVTIQAGVLDMIRELQQQNNTAMIMITHDFGVVAQTCDNVAVVYAGQIVEYGTKRQIFKNPSHPYTLGLFGAIPKLNVRVRRLHSIKGMPVDPTDLPNGCYFSPRCPYADEECCSSAIPMRTIEEGHQCRCIHTEKILRD